MECQYQSSMTETPFLLVHFGRSFSSYEELNFAFSSAYHHQSGEQLEIVNRCLENYLRCFAGTKLKEWLKWLSLTEWWHVLLPR